MVTKVNFLHPSFIHLSRIKVFLIIDCSDHGVECLETKVDGKLAELFQQGLECKNVNVYCEEIIESVTAIGFRAQI